MKKRKTKDLSSPFPHLPSKCVGVLWCQLTKSWSRWEVNSRSLLFAHHSTVSSSIKHLPTQFGWWKGKTSSLFGFLFFVGTLLLQRLSFSSHRSEGKGQWAQLDLSFTHQRGKRRGEPLSEFNLSSPSHCFTVFCGRQQ